MASYNILTEPWISVLQNNGMPAQMSVMDVFEHAHELQAITESTPLATYSVTRLLLGFLLDAYRPQNLSDLLELEQAGKLDMDAIRRYIKLCEAEGVSFDLFDAERPFLQSVHDPILDGQKPVSAAKLIYHIPSGSNKTLFDPGHRQEKDAVLSVPAAFKGLLVNLIFLGTGGAGYFSNLNGAPCTYFLVEGNNLFQTLVRNIPLSEYVGIEYEQPPVLWRYKEKIDRSDMTEISFLLGFICPSRRIQLRPVKEQGSTVIRNCWYSPGHKFTNKDIWQDPHMAYYYDKKDVRRPVQPVRGRKIWQDIATILYQDGSHIPPQNVLTYMDAIEERKVDDPVLRLHIYSFITGTHCTNHEMMQESEMRLPADLLRDPTRLPLMVECIKLAEEKERKLRFALRTACHMRLAKDSEKVVFQRIIDEAQADFMHKVEKLFYDLLFKPVSADQTDIPGVMDQWSKDIQSLALQTYDHFFTRFRQTGRAMYESLRCRGMLFNKKEKDKEDPVTNGS